MQNLSETLTESQKKELGAKLVALFQIKKIKGSVDRYPLGLDHNDKTELGIAETVLGLIQNVEKFVD